ncbi:MAG: hypothetical protein A2Y38_14640 [Spirochaetes bacterium GWB1_59_5]|nr:MAG: hypothetical protein A2Y38_14640 [Spirochaetes bacterium GWB1_59_5]
MTKMIKVSDDDGVVWQQIGLKKAQIMFGWNKPVRVALKTADPFNPDTSRLIHDKTGHTSLPTSIIEFNLDLGLNPRWDRRFNYFMREDDLK